MKKKSLACGLWAVAVLVAADANAAGGTIVKLQGTASIENKSGTSPASESSSLYSGDSLKVDPSGKAQIHFEDDSLFAVSGGSTFKVEDFTMPRKDAGGTAIFSLLRGGLRTITGSISKGGHDHYELRTPMSTISVRGTAYSALLCAGDCTAHGRFKEGLYVRDHSGTVTLTNGGGQIALKPGQTAFAESNTTAPILVEASPFNDPKVSLHLGIDADVNTEVHPPRIEPDHPASPS